MFQEEEEKSNSKPILVAAIVLVVLAAAGALWFWKKNNHAAVEATITQVEVMPLHQQYSHVYGNAGADQVEDATYILARVKVNNRNDAAPAFLKDFTVTFTTKDGEEQTSTALEKDDLAMVLNAFKEMQPLADKLGGKPLLRETEIARTSSAEGYIVFQFPGKPDLWQQRKDATLRIDLYHNGIVSTAFPK